MQHVYTPVEFSVMFKYIMSPYVTNQSKHLKFRIHEITRRETVKQKDPRVEISGSDMETLYFRTRALLLESQEEKASQKCQELWWRNFRHQNGGKNLCETNINYIIRIQIRILYFTGIFMGFHGIYKKYIDHIWFINLLP